MSTWLLLAPLMSIIYCTGLSDSQNTSCLPLFLLWLQLFSSATVFLASVCPYQHPFPPPHPQPLSSYPALCSLLFWHLALILLLLLNIPWQFMLVPPANGGRPRPSTPDSAALWWPFCHLLTLYLPWAITTRLRKLFAVTSQTGRQVGCAEIRCLY